MNCCKTCYSICEPLISCFEDLIIYVPIGYLEDQIKVRIKNGQGYVTYQTLDVLGGTHVEINVETAAIPEGFFSSFGGPYEIRFLNPSLQELNFVAVDGKMYNCISFNVANGSTDETVAIINAFYTVIPEDMNTNINYVSIALNEQQNQFDELTFLQALNNQQ